VGLNGRQDEGSKFQLRVRWKFHNEIVCSLGWICRRGAGDRQVYGFSGGAMEVGNGQSLHDE